MCTEFISIFDRTWQVCRIRSRNSLPFLSTWVICPFVLFHLIIVLSILRLTDSDWPFWYLQTLLFTPPSAFSGVCIAHLFSLLCCLICFCFLHLFCVLCPMLSMSRDSPFLLPMSRDCPFLLQMSRDCPFLLPMSRDCPFLVSPSVSSNVYLNTLFS